MKIARIETLVGKVAGGKKINLNETRPESASIVAVRVHTDTKLVGIGFTSSVNGAEAIRKLIDGEMAPSLVGDSPLDHERLLAKTKQRFRATGWAGLIARAYAAIDVALWDLKGKIAKLPIHLLLGGARTAAPCFVGDLAPLGCDAAATIKSASKLLEQGVLGVGIDVGGGEMQLDADRVQQIRDGLGESAWLGINAGGRYDMATALAMGHFYEEDVGIDWIESPISNDDHVGYQRLAERMEVSIAVGASFDTPEEFRAIVERRTAKVLRPDPFRLGGITPLLKLIAFAEMSQLTVVPSRCPEIGVQLACGLPAVPMVEHGSWMSGAFQSSPSLVKGKLTPSEGFGFGLELEESFFAK
jgi:L-talarate/galactarate dehydratase